MVFPSRLRPHRIDLIRNIDAIDLLDKRHGIERENALVKAQPKELANQ